MALNVQTFKTRALTALIFVAVMLAGLLWNYWSFFILITIIHFGCWFEYFALIDKIFSVKLDVVIKWFFAIAGFVLVIVIGVRDYFSDFGVIWFGFKISMKWVFYLILFIGLIAFLQNKSIPRKAKWMYYMGLAYISLSFAFFLYIRDASPRMGDNGSLVDLGMINACGIIFSIWINDTMAYLVGSFIGKTPLSRISPKKTWEGTLGGIILGVIVIGLLYPYLVYQLTSLQLERTWWFVIPAVCAVFGTAGDLFESKLKRMADVKDSGSFMPGHGGFLDRFDSLLFAAPAVWIYLQLVNGL